jgi:hypothetical protein
MLTSVFARRHAGRSHRSANAPSRKARLAIDRLESRIALAVDTLSIGGDTTSSFIDSTGDLVVVSITGTAGTAVFRDEGGGIVDNGDNIASIAITGASSDFQLTVGASLGLVPTGIGPLNGVDTVYLGRVTADSVIRGINTVGSDGFFPVGGPTAARSDMIRFSLESFVGMDFSKGGGLFVDRVTGGEDNLGILLTTGFSPYSTIAIREELDAVVVLGAENNGTADGRLLIQSATADSRIFVNNAGSTGANSKLEILGGEGPFDAGVTFRGPFAGTVNLQSPAGGTWLFEGDVAPSAVLKAAKWDGRTANAPVDTDGVVARRGFAGTLNATNGVVSLTVGGAVKGTARINAGGDVMLDAQSVEAGAEINSEGNATLTIGRNFAGRVSAETVRATVGGNVAGAVMTGGSSVELAVTGSITNSTLACLYGVSGTVGGNISKSVLSAGSDAVDLDVGGNIVNSRLLSGNDIRSRINGSVSGSELKSADNAVSLAVKGTLTSSLVDAYDNMTLDVDGTVSKSQVFYGRFNGSDADLQLDVGGDLLNSEVVGRSARAEAIVNVARDARGVRFASRDSNRGDRQYTIGRNFQGSIQAANANVSLDVGGAVQKGSSLVTGGNAAVNVARNFDGVVDVNALQFRVQGNVTKDSRIVAGSVREWQVDFTAFTPQPNFFIGGRLDGIVNVGVFDASPGDITVTILGGGAGKSARFYVGRFETNTIVFAGNFQGNIRVMGDLGSDLQFTGNLDRITIGGQVLSDITVGGTLSYLNSNSWFEAIGSGKQIGNFRNGSFRTTGTLTTGKYVTVVPVGPLVG